MFKVKVKLSANLVKISMWTNLARKYEGNNTSDNGIFIVCQVGKVAEIVQLQAALHDSTRLWVTAAFL